MRTQLKYYIAVGVAAAALAAGTQMLLADTSAEATVSEQDQQPQPRRPGLGGPPAGGPGMPGMRMRGPGGPMGPGFRGLDLTDDQQAQLKQIADSHADAFKAAGEKARAAHEGMGALLDADTIDEGAIRAKSQEVATAQAEVMILNAKVRKESMQVLTAEQLETLKERREQRPDGPRMRKPGA